MPFLCQTCVKDVAVIRTSELTKWTQQINSGSDGTGFLNEKNNDIKKTFFYHNYHTWTGKQILSRIVLSKKILATPLILILSNKLKQFMFTWKNNELLLLISIFIVNNNHLSTYIFWTIDKLKKKSSFIR
jgi:hypothetical protein